MVLPEKCNGCGLCVAVCPGLAIFIVDPVYKPGRAAVSFAYEYLPVPTEGDTVPATDREGHVVCSAVVEKVVSAKKYDMTRVVTISIPAEHAHTVRGILKNGRAAK
jgi:Fe-S-cluster-containing hydrogenase component 2